MKIYDINNNLILDIQVNDESYQRSAVMSEDNLYLYYSLQNPVALPLYSYCEFNGRRYTLMDEENFTKINTENHEYKVMFESYIGYLKRCKFEYFTLNTKGEINSDIEIDFSLTFSPASFARLIVDNMNQKDATGGWQVGECIEAEERLLDFNDMYCLDALTYIAEQFNTEWEVDGKTIYIRKVERDKKNPLPVAYGQGKGLLSGLERTNFKNRIGAVRIKTSDRNINRATYGSATLKMPRNHTVTYNGVEYVTDASGSRLTRKVPLFKSPIIPTDTLDLTNIYPRRVGTISSVVKVNESKNLYDIIDLDNEIDFASNIIPGENMTLIFQGGQLSGREFDVTYIHAERRFEIVPLTDRGMMYPTPGIEPEVGGKYAVFHIQLPQEYITSAETEALNLALKHLYEHEQPQFTYKATLDKIFAKAKWTEIGRYFRPGYFVRLSEPQHLPEPVDIRIVAVKRYVNNPYMPEVELSNSVTGHTIGSTLEQLQNKEQTIDRSKGESISFTKRRFRDSQQALTMLEKAVQGFSEGINPIWVKSMAALFGDESLQFRFVNNKTTPEIISSGIVFNNTTKILTCPARSIQHMSIGINALSSQHPVSSYTFFDMQAFDRTLINETEAMYLYAKCDKTTKRGTYLLSTEPFTFDSADGNYYLLVGILSDEFDGTRSYVEVYGFTEILPGRITLWKIVDPDGFQYWDMLNKAFRIGDPNNYLAYNVDGLRRVVLKGIMVQSPSGSESPLPVHVGAYSSSRQYYAGDEVTYNGSTYRAIRDTKGIVPTNTTYWTVIAQKGNPGNPGNPGSDGRDGPGSRSIYFPARSTSEAPSAPLGTGSNTPSGWWTYPSYPSESYKYIYVTTSQYDGASWSSWSTPTLYAQKGIPGALPTTRKWKSGETYVRNDRIVDYIIFKDTDETTSWWRVREGYTSVVAGSRPNTSYFEQISSYEAIATTVLLAEQANLAEFIFKQGQLVSQDTNSGGVPNLILNGKTGYIQALSGRFMGSIGTPFKDIEATSNPFVLNIDNHFNYRILASGGSDVTVSLPSGSKYSGVHCYLFNSKTMGTIKVASEGSTIGTIGPMTLGMFINVGNWVMFATTSKY